MDFLDAVFSSPPPAQPEEQAPAAQTPSAPPPVPASMRPAAAVPVSATKLAGLEAKLQTLEQELAKERERALTSEIKLRENQAAQNTVEHTLEKLYEKTSKERTEQELRVIREKASARVEALEGRLDEFQRGILEILNKQNEARRRDDQEVVREGHTSLENRLAVFQREMVEIMQTYWERKEQAVQDTFQSSQQKFLQAIDLIQKQAQEHERQFTQSADTLKQESKLAKESLELQAHSSQNEIARRLQDLDDKITAAGKVTEAARLVLFAIDKIDPLLIDKATYDELQKAKEVLAKFKI